MSKAGKEILEGLNQTSFSKINLENTLKEFTNAALIDLQRMRDKSKKSEFIYEE